MSKQDRIDAYRRRIDTLTDGDGTFMLKTYQAYEMCRSGVIDLETCEKYVGGYLDLGYQVASVRRERGHEDPAQRGALIVTVSVSGFAEFALDITFDLGSITWKARWAKET